MPPDEADDDGEDEEESAGMGVGLDHDRAWQAWQHAAARPRVFGLQPQANMVDASLTSSVRRSARSVAVNCGHMDMPFITGRAALADAASLLETYGDDAGFEAAAAPSTP